VARGCLKRKVSLRLISNHSCLMLSSMNSGLPPHRRELARKVAQHEMGHYVVAHLLGFQTGDVSIEIIGPINGHRGAAAVILAEPMHTLEDVGCYIRRCIQVLYAGAFAETLPPRQSPMKSVNHQEAMIIIGTPGSGAEQDAAKARELIRILRNIQHAEEGVESSSDVEQQLQAISDELWENALDLVQRHADLIIGLAGNLSDRVKRTNEMVVLDASYLENFSAIKALVPVSEGTVA
jgi:hypothetical protein